MDTYATNRAFTLIELLVVIAIIGLLSSVVLASLNDARMKARDAKRLSDMHQLQNALELYYTTYNQYPRSPGGSICSTCLEGANHADWINAGQMPAFLPAIPVDPTRAGSTNGYRYQHNNRQSYTMLVRLERNPSWCRVGVPPGVGNWNQTNNPNQWPVC